VNQRASSGTALTWRFWAFTCLRALASLRLAVVLLVVLGAVLAWATLLEASRGREHAQWYVYTSPWFMILLGLLGLNILASTLVRLPWKRHQTGFVFAHAGLLVVLAGAVQSFLYGIEGQVVLQEGEQTDRMLLSTRSRISVAHRAAADRSALEFTFAPGPADWAPKQRLNFAASNDLSLSILRFYRHAREQVDWVADEQDYQGPALKLRLLGNSGNIVTEAWLAGSLFGGEAVIGPTAYQLWPLPLETMVEDFLDPPQDPAGAGILSMHYEGRMVRVPVAENVGRTIPLGDTGVAVEIIAYLADARPGPNGRFLARSEQPRNPLVELKVHLPGEDEPTRQVAFAKLPLLNLDGVYGRICPVRFWFHHGGVSPTAGAVFAQSPSGTLYCRPVVNGAYGAPVEVRKDSRIPLGGQFSVVLLRHLPRARQNVSFHPVENDLGAAEVPEAAALVELTVGEVRRELWLQRGAPQYGVQSVLTENGSVTLEFGYEQVPLGYNLELKKFIRDSDPGRADQAGLTSIVRLTDPEQGLDEQREISLNAPLSQGKFIVYQSGFRDAGHGRQASVLTVAYDPGRLLKYSGGLMVCVGILGMMLRRSSRFRNGELPVDSDRSGDSSPVTGHRDGLADQPAAQPVLKPIVPRRRHAQPSSRGPCPPGDS
jgi:hypothetical protein